MQGILGEGGTPRGVLHKYLNNSHTRLLVSTAKSYNNIKVYRSDVIQSEELTYC